MELQQLEKTATNGNQMRDDYDFYYPAVTMAMGYKKTLWLKKSKFLSHYSQIMPLFLELPIIPRGAYYSQNYASTFASSLSKRPLIISNGGHYNEGFR